MQKVLRRSKLASNQAARRSRILSQKDRHDRWRARFQGKTVRNRELLNQARDERVSRREDWQLGPIAPKRDVGPLAEKYGTVSGRVMQMPKVLKEERARYINNVAGDRVVIVRGRERGRIGVVRSVDSETECVVVEGLRQYDVEIPSFALALEQDKRPFRTYSAPIPLTDIRLVVPLSDPSTNTTKDVVIRSLYAGKPFIEPEYGSPTPSHTRYIRGLDTPIPWPEAELKEEIDEDVDTLRIEVEDPTWTPTLQTPPMPGGVIDELRNKYSKYRTRHDPEWVREKELEDMRERWSKGRKLLTPMQQFWEEKRKQRERRGPAHMTRETENVIENFLRNQRGQRQGLPV